MHNRDEETTIASTIKYYDEEEYFILTFCAGRAVTAPGTISKFRSLSNLTWNRRSLLRETIRSTDKGGKELYASYGYPNFFTISLCKGCLRK